MTVHEIRLEMSRTGRWRSICSCGEYRSSSYTYRGAAEDVGAQHVRSKRRTA